MAEIQAGPRPDSIIRLADPKRVRALDEFLQDMTSGVKTGVNKATAHLGDSEPAILDEATDYNGQMLNLIMEGKVGDWPGLEMSGTPDVSERFDGRVELKDIAGMPDEYTELLRRVLTIQADCEIGDPHLYVEHVLPAAP